MSEERPEKEAVRGLWLETVMHFDGAYPEDDVPLYLTLSGAEGRDIELLIENQLIETTETGAIALSHRHRVIAVERSTPAMIELQRRFPGLKIVVQSFQNLVRSESPFRWPDGEDERLCCARVINLDLDETLRAVEDRGEVSFPVLLWIRKLGQIHAARALDWSICLTLHGEISWSSACFASVRQFLAENFENDEEFARMSRLFLSESLFEDIASGRDLDVASLSVRDQQLLLMVFVPKKISQLLCPQGWRVETARNLRYGGNGGRAPMVTWIMHVTRDARVSGRPLTIYRESLRTVLSGAGRIEEDGTVS